MEHRLVCRNRISGSIQHGHWGSHIEAIQRWVKTVGQSRSNMEYWIEERAQGGVKTKIFVRSTYLDLIEGDRVVVTAIANHRDKLNDDAGTLIIFELENGHTGSTSFYMPKEEFQRRFELVDDGWQGQRSE